MPAAYTPQELDRYVEAWSQPGAATGMVTINRSSGPTQPKRAEAALSADPGADAGDLGEKDRYLGEDLAEPSRDDVPNLDRVERLP